MAVAGMAADVAASGSLDGVRVGEEDLLQHVGAARTPGGVVVQPEGLQPAVLAEGLGQAEEPHLAQRVGGLEQGG
jgi:hypothetical protein